MWPCPQPLIPLREMSWTSHENLACHKRDKVRVQRFNFQAKNKSHEYNNVPLGPVLSHVDSLAIYSVT